MIKRIPLEELRRLHPMPWTAAFEPKGQVRVLDTNHNEVPLFALLSFALDITSHLAKSPKPQQGTP